MSMYKYIRELWKQPKKNLSELYRQRLIEWRREPVTMRIARPTRIDRARSLGYKAKQGFIVVRQRVAKSKRMREKNRAGRRPKHNRLRKVLSMNYQQIAELRANRKFKNCEVLNSYQVAEDGKHKWFEIILIDRNHPQIKKDKNVKGVAAKKGRAFRGLTSAGRKSRGLRKKGKGAEKIRPSQRANKRRAK